MRPVLLPQVDAVRHAMAALSVIWPEVALTRTEEDPPTFVVNETSFGFLVDLNPGAVPPPSILNPRPAPRPELQVLIFRAVYTPATRHEPEDWDAVDVEWWPLHRLQDFATSLAMMVATERIGHAFEYIGERELAEELAEDIEYDG